MSTTQLRSISQIVAAKRTVEGGGFVVHRPFPTPEIDHIDPFLLLDEMGPVHYEPGKAVGAPSHPHRGFETVTYLIDGAMEHQDTTGTRAVIRSGGVQWMTAGSGVVHSELPTDEFLQRGGSMHGFQLWVNLPASKKMIPPRYQGYNSEELPTVSLPNGGVIKVVAGEVHGVVGPVETTRPMTYAHATLNPGDVIEWSPAEGHSALVHVFDGHVTVNDREVSAINLVIFDRTAGQVRVVADDAPSQVLLLGGQPLGEPVSRYGPFVMNSRQEIVQAIEDYQSGQLVK